MAAASMGLARTSRAASTDDSERNGASPAPENQEGGGASSLLSLPDTPSKVPVRKQPTTESSEIVLDVSENGLPFGKESCY